MWCMAVLPACMRYEPAPWRGVAAATSTEVMQAGHHCDRDGRRSCFRVAETTGKLAPNAACRALRPADPQAELSSCAFGSPREEAVAILGVAPASPAVRFGRGERHDRGEAALKVGDIGQACCP